jgi:hypothetical protein
VFPLLRQVVSDNLSTKKWYSARAISFFIVRTGPVTDMPALPTLSSTSSSRTSAPAGRHSRTWVLVLLGILLGGWTYAFTAQGDQSPNPSFASELVASEPEVLQALHEVLEDHIIHGTRQFEREPTLNGAEEAPSTPLFSRWQGDGKVFYKVRKDVVAPRHFMESNDSGTIAVRYVVVSLTPQRTRVQIDAVFVESAHRAVHTSDLTVEASEFKAIQEHLQANQYAEQEARDLKRRRDSADLVKQTMIRRHEDESTLLASAQSSVKDLEGRLKDLRHEIERRVKAPGTDLKAAPFQSSAKIITLPAYTEVVIVIVTPHWYGVQTPDGQRGWIAIDQLEALP